MLAARVGDMHVCPMQTPVGVATIPHVGGPILPPGVPQVLIGKMPAAVLGNMCVCVGPPDSIIGCCTNVMIGKRPAARMSSTTVHGGSIVAGCPTVILGSGAANIDVAGLAAQAAGAAAQVAGATAQAMQDIANEAADLADRLDDLPDDAPQWRRDELQAELDKANQMLGN